MTKLFHTSGDRIGVIEAPEKPTLDDMAVPDGNGGIDFDRTKEREWEEYTRQAIDNWVECEDQEKALTILGIADGMSYPKDHTYHGVPVPEGGEVRQWRRDDYESGKWHNMIRGEGEPSLNEYRTVYRFSPVVEKPIIIQNDEPQLTAIAGDLPKSEQGESQEIPEWIIEYDKKNYQSSAGKAIRILLDIIIKRKPV